MNNENVVFLLPDIKGGGAEKSVINLCLSIQKHSHYKCHLIVLGDVVEYDISKIDVHFLKIRGRFKKSGLNRFTYRQKMASYIDDYIIENFGRDSAVFSNMVLCDKIMSKSRLNVHHIIRNSYGSSILSGKNWIKRKLESINISKAYSNHPLIFVSQGALNSFEDNFTTTVPKKVIYNAIDVETIRQQALEYKPVQHDYVLHVGRFNHQKRQDRLIDIFSNTETSEKLLLLGQGELESSLKAQISSLDLDARVQMVEFDPNPYPYILNAKVVVLTSDFEGLPRVMMEAVALGKPVVAFDCVGGIREVITNPNSLIDVNDSKGFSEALVDALKNPDKYTSKQRIEFLPNYVAQEFIDTIEASD